MNIVRSLHDGNTYFLFEGNLYFTESTFDNRQGLIEDAIPNDMRLAEESELTDEQLYNLGTALGLPLGRMQL